MMEDGGLAYGDSMSMADARMMGDKFEYDYLDVEEDAFRTVEGEIPWTMMPSKAVEMIHDKMGDLERARSKGAAPS